MEEKIIIGDPVQAGEIRIVTLSALYRGTHYGRAAFGYGEAVPFAVIAISPQQTRVFLITGEETSLDELAEEVPGVRKVVMAV
jgi:uncharacterized spore protein YtfJ